MPPSPGTRRGVLASGSGRALAAPCRSGDDVSGALARPARPWPRPGTGAVAAPGQPRRRPLAARGPRRLARPDPRRSTHVVAVDTGSRDGSAASWRRAFGARCVSAPARRRFPAAVALGLERLRRRGPHPSGSGCCTTTPTRTPAPSRRCSPRPRPTPAPTSSAPSCASGPRCGGCSRSASPSPAPAAARPAWSAASTTRASTTTSATVLAVNTAGMLVRRSVLEELGGFDEQLPSSATTSTSAGAPRRPGTARWSCPTAVVFHAEAAHRGAAPHRRSPGRHTHYQERRAALYTLLANAAGASAAVPGACAWRSGTLLRMLGFLLVRSVGEALDELAALVSVYSAPRRVLRARRAPARRPRATADHADVRALLAPRWLPYRHGLDFVSDLAAAADQPGRRRRRAAPRGRRRARPVVVRRRAGAATRATRTSARGRTPAWSPASSPTRSRSLLAAGRAGRAGRRPRTRFGSVAGGGLSPGARAASATGGGCTSSPGTRSGRAPPCRRRRTCCRWRCSAPLLGGSADARRSRWCSSLAVPLGAVGCLAVPAGRRPAGLAAGRAALAAAVGRHHLRPGPGGQRRLGRGPARARSSAPPCCPGWRTPRSASPTPRPTAAGGPPGASGLLLALVDRLRPGRLAPGRWCSAWSWWSPGSRSCPRRCGDRSVWGPPRGDRCSTPVLLLPRGGCRSLVQRCRRRAAARHRPAARRRPGRARPARRPARRPGCARPGSAWSCSALALLALLPRAPASRSLVVLGGRRWSPRWSPPCSRRRPSTWPRRPPRRASRCSSVLLPGCVRGRGGARARRAWSTRGPPGALPLRVGPRRARGGRGSSCRWRGWRGSSSARRSSSATARDDRHPGLHGAELAAGRRARDPGAARQREDGLSYTVRRGDGVTLGEDEILALTPRGPRLHR